jgi:predicted amidophosphoribosyltransferase
LLWYAAGMGADNANTKTSERRFVWPPRPGGAVAAASRPAEVAASIAEPPPHPIAAAASPALTAPASRCTGFRAGLLEIERTWLGLTTPPLADRIAAAAWAADAPGAYCRRCGSTVGPHEAGPEGCPACRSRRLPWERMVRLGDYTGLLREVIQEIKFTRWRRLGDQVGGLLGISLVRAIRDEGLDPAAAALVPVPSSFRRRMSRGIDHSLVIARGISRETGIPVVQALARSHRPSQLSVPSSRRGSNVAGSIRAREGVDLAGRLVIVLDDVTTTRATLNASARAVLTACKPLLDNDLRIRIWTAVVAVTPVAGRRRPGAAVEEPG